MSITYNYKPQDYTPKPITDFSEKEARKEYARLRKNAMKRLKNLENSEYAGDDFARWFIRHPFTASSKLKSRAELQNALARVYRFLESKKSSVTGMNKIRSQAIKTLHSHGYTFVNKQNFKQFGEFMEQVRNASGAAVRPSDIVAEIYGAAEKKELKPDELMKDFEYWAEHYNELNKLPKNQNSKLSDYKKRVGRK